MKQIPLRLACGVLLAAAACALTAPGRCAAAEGTATAADSATVARADGLEAARGALRMRVTALADDLLRVRIAPAGQWPEDASWVVPAALRAQSVTVQPLADGFRTALLQVHVDAATLRLSVTDLAGHAVSEDAPDEPLRMAGSRFTLRKIMPAGEHYFGLGDKAGPLDRRGQAFSNWNTDAYGFQESSDPLYKSVPFFAAVGGPGGSYGIFLDNTWRSWFDFGRRDPQRLEIGADDGAIDYYLIYGPALRRVVERYTDLSGRAPLPPLWSLGFQQSRYSYMSAAELLGVAARLRAERIPADVLWMDIDYQDRNRPFTTNPLTFPDLAGLAARMRQQGFRLVAITDLHIAAAAGQGYAPYDSGVAGDHFVRRADGSPYVAEVWPGPAVFPDFTRSATRRWWGGLYRDFLAAGISGFWNDMNEPAVFKTVTKTMPPDNLHRIDEPGFVPRVAAHAEIHNIYGMENARATFEGLSALAPDERPFVMTRASFAGGQRYGATWTGDNSSTWNHLKLSIAMLLNLGLSGFAYSGDDVGGFNGTPDADLFTRWIELTAFMPLFRDHSMKGVAGKEPWIHGPVHTAIRRRFIGERYRLLPYIYALADENSRTGAPLMRPVFYDYPDALQSPCEQANSFLLGRSLLVAPSPALESPAAYEVCLPAGRWYDYWTGLQASASPKVQPRIDQLPVYVRGGTILPRQPLVQSTAATPSGPLTLDVFPGAADADGVAGAGACRGTLYADDGHSLGYRSQGYLRQALRCMPAPDGIRIEFDARTGAFAPWWHEIEVHVHGWSGGAHAVLRSGPGSPAASLVAKVDERAGVVSVRIGDQAGAAQLSIRRGP